MLSSTQQVVKESDLGPERRRASVGNLINGQVSRYYRLKQAASEIETCNEEIEIITYIAQTLAKHRKTKHISS